jgi:hypothetical protein
MLTWLLSIAVAGVIGAGAILWIKKETLPPPLISFERMGHLVSLKVSYADVVEFTESRSLKIPWFQWEVPYGGTKVLLIARGDCSFATDLRLARYQAIDSPNRKVSIVLPHPVAFQPRLNHASPSEGGTRIYAISDQGVEAIIPGTENRTKAIQSAMALGQQRIEESCSNQDAIMAAKFNAETILAASFNAIGWNASIAWR